MRANTEVSSVGLNFFRGCLVATAQTDLHGETLRRFGQDVLANIQASRCRSLIIDLAGVEILDLYDFDGIRDIARMASYLGARPIIAGLQPGIAAALAELDADISGLQMAGTVEHAFEILRPEVGPEA